jgi:hypothetical protein
MTLDEYRNKKQSTTNNKPVSKLDEYRSRVNNSNLSVSSTNNNPFLPNKPLDLLYNPRAIKQISQVLGKGAEVVGELHQPILATKPVQVLFDILSRGQYASANTVKKIVEGKPLEVPKAAWEGLIGKEKGNYRDIIEQVAPNVPDAVKNIGGFIGDVVLDPTTYLSGGTTKLGKLKTISKGREGLEALKDLKTAEELAKTGKLTEDAANLLNKSKTFTGKTAKDVIKNIDKVLEPSGKNLTEKAAKGEVSLINFAGKPILPKGVNKKIFEVADKTGDALKQNESFQNIYSKFNTKPFKATDEEEAVYNLNKQRQNAMNFENQKAIELGKDLSKEADVLKKKHNLTDSDLFDILEKKTSSERRYKTIGGVDRRKNPVLREVMNNIGEKYAPNNRESWVNIAKKLETYLRKKGDLTTQDVINFFGTPLAKKEIGDARKLIPAATIKKITAYEEKGRFLDIVDKLKKKKPISSLSQETAEDLMAFRKKVNDLNKQNLKMEEAVGVKTNTFWSPSINYVPRVATKEAKEGFKATKNTEPFISNIPVVNTKAGYQKGRKTSELLATQVTTKDGQKIFIDNPAIAQAIRNAASGKVRSNAEFLDNVINNPKLSALKDNAPENFRDVKLPGFWEKGEYKVWDPYNGKTKGLRFHPAAAEAIEKTFIPKESGMLEKFLESKPIKKLDDIQNKWWKPRALASPGAVFRNAVGNIINPTLIGTAPTQVKNAFDIVGGKQGKIVDALGKTYTFDQVREYIDRLGVRGTGGYASDIESAVLEQVKKPTKGQLLNPLGGQNAYVRGVRKANETVEDVFRVNVFVDQLKKGYSPQKAAEQVEKVLFNYGDLTDFERKLKKAFPFYTWYKNNAKLQLEGLITQPGKYALIPKGINAVQNQFANKEIPQEALSSWMLENIPVNLGTDEKGKSKVFLLKNWLPQGDLANLIDPNRLKDLPLEMLSPIAGKALAEYFANKSFAFDTATEKTPGELGKFLGVDMPKRLINLLRSDRLLNDLDKIIFKNELPIIERLASYATGGKLYGVDRAKGLSYALSALKKEIGDIKAQMSRYARTIRDKTKNESERKTAQKNLFSAQFLLNDRTNRVKEVAELYNKENVGPLEENY